MWKFCNQANCLMTLQPNKSSVIDAVKSLGFEVEKIKDSSADFVINLGQKS
jgi:hypothetical protein